MTRYLILAGLVATLPLVGGVADAQAPKTCVQQYADAPGVTPANLITGGFEIKAGWPGGLWLQKGKETYFCNAGRPLDSETMCWTLREPVRGSPCP